MLVVPGVRSSLVFSACPSLVVLSVFCIFSILRSLRNAGKMLTPSFLRKDKKVSCRGKEAVVDCETVQGPKKSLYPKTTPTGRQHISEKLDR